MNSILGMYGNYDILTCFI